MNGYRAILSLLKTIIFTHRAAKELDSLPAEARSAVTSALNEYALTGAGDVKALSGRAGYRLRIGRYRVIFAEDGVTILALHVGKRDTITYRKN